MEGLLSLLFGPRPPLVSPQPPMSLDQAVAQMQQQGWKEVTPQRSTPTPTPIPIPQPRTLSNFEELIQVAKPIFNRYQIPLEVGLGQLQGETNPKAMGWQRNNFANLGAYDSNPQNAFSYPTPEKGVEAFAKLLSGKYELGEIGSGKFDTRYLPAYDLRTDPAAMIKKIQEIGYASRPDYAQFIMSTPAWQQYHTGLPNTGWNL